MVLGLGGNGSRGNLDFFSWLAVGGTAFDANLGNLVQGLLTLVGEVAEVGVIRGQHGVGVIDEELGTVGVLARVGHCDGTLRVGHRLLGHL